ncbi:MAG: hypothetical protein SGJ09_08705 [Phycisphaerae bacterium]|nr:hypothetical protein [Phycisphaerae bacterium]
MSNLSTAMVTPAEATSPGRNPRANSPAKASSSANAGLVGRLLAMRPILRWCIIVAILLGIYSFADEYPWQTARSFDVKSDRLERVLEDANSRVAAIEGSEEIKAAVGTFGAIRIPREERDGTLALSKSIDRVMKDSKVKYSLDVRSAGKFPSGALPGIAATGERIEKVVGEMKFDATQDVTAMILQSLEASPDIESVSRVKLSKPTSSPEKKVNVQLTVEAWVRVPESARR